MSVKGCGLPRAMCYVPVGRGCIQGARTGLARIRHVWVPLAVPLSVAQGQPDRARDLDRAVVPSRQANGGESHSPGRGSQKGWDVNLTRRGARTQEVLPSVLRTLWQQKKGSFAGLVELMRSPRERIATGSGIRGRDVESLRKCRKADKLEQEFPILSHTSGQFGENPKNAFAYVRVWNLQVDVDGQLDTVVSNKKGVNVLVQLPLGFAQE